ncbi:hypothetical protein DMN91_001882, partial [Ooceraea biroi]
MQDLKSFDSSRTRKKFAM